MPDLPENILEDSVLPKNSLPKNSLPKNSLPKNTLPKKIVIMGGGRNIGKTRLCNAIAEILNNSQIIKTGHHLSKPHKNDSYFAAGTLFSTILNQFKNKDFFIIESGSILKDPDFKADLIIFLPVILGANKPGSEQRMAKAHIVRSKTMLSHSESLNEKQVKLIELRLGISTQNALRILAAIHNVY